MDAPPRAGLKSPAKINLFLEVVGRRDDGFHDIESVFLETNLCDELDAEMSDDGRITLICSDPALPTDDRNLVVRAAGLLRRRAGVRGGLRFALRKAIPRGGGLGGGSSNAAAALRLANSLWKCGLDDGALADLAAEVGSDVPFFLTGGICLCRGRGEEVTPLPPFPSHVGLLLALPDIHSDTAAAYRGLELPPAGSALSAREFIAAMAAGDVDAMERAGFNRFERTVFAAIPELGRLHRELEALTGRRARMSGSGAALWCLVRPGDAGPAGLAGWEERNGVKVVTASAANSIRMG